MIRKSGSVLGRRIERERKTLRAMLGLFCRSRHDVNTAPCPECRKVLDYALSRLDHCPFGEHKPTCARCPIHCYRPAMRERIRSIMRYSGPRMLMRHPLLALAHLRDSRFAPKVDDRSKH
jgi:hypothetical protein